MVKKPARLRKKIQRNVPNGIAHICASFNNTIVSITDSMGNVISWASAGKVGFKGSRKSNAYAASLTALDAGRAAMAAGMREVEVYVKGPGMGREPAMRALQSVGLIITIIRDVTPLAHNGCRPQKRRRV